MDQLSTSDAKYLIPLSKSSSSESSFANRSQTEEIETSSIEPVAQDMFQVYSTEGLVAHELEVFGITRITSKKINSKPGYSSEREKRKSRVSTEVHPDLLFAEFLAED
eukprot:CAMPEP_0171417136 /NCGR_PEP_ID=MMETSP0880-20121228/40449_1 /TAXON_ID=67004 /ORGANISM="Thalassiosira weissflogii, Strain CCMP1336" /LENGTH=107 /DNA_ID=CAMNT_0011935393 /DNA_START=431 /DNA_END=754 /DNA_ORIENTATION=+